MQFGIPFCLGSKRDRFIFTGNHNCFPWKRRYIIGLMAVEQEHMGTSFNPGQRFLHGIGIEKNVPEAVRLFRYAAKNGSEEAKKN